MSLKENLQQGWRSLGTRRLRTILSTLGVMFGVVAVVTMLSIGEGAKLETLHQIEQLGMNSIIIRQNDLSEEQILKTRERHSRGLTQEDFSALAQGVPHLAHLAALRPVDASISASFVTISPEILAVSDHFKEVKGLSLAEGRFVCAIDIQQRQHVCVLGDEIAKTLGKYGHVGQTVRLEGVEFKIVGVLKNRSWKAGKSNALTSRNLNKGVFIPLGTEATLPYSKNSLKQGMLAEIILQLSDSQKMAQALQLIRRIMERAHEQVEDYQIVVPQELLNQAYRTQYTFNLVLGSIAAISLLVGGIGIMNIMLATVSERTREIGIRRAVGANRMHIVAQFLTETLLLTLLGAAGGVCIGILFSLLISLFAGWTTVVTLWSIILSMGMAVTTGACSGLYPAIKAAHMNPITALRHD